ncbi:MAG: Stp1/IreP family PP2C-type Ser/Thr phosphatase [Labilithrix sp.]|nr:Stp1/IreP family PP2C-type Ser/Thr phosphatase [Labilithrix sp.]MBX3220165.1 Stp1/IreP family PP2C-type Ser/Thr phosphatase [Labilithrix sp.]
MTQPETPAPAPAAGGSTSESSNAREDAPATEVRVQLFARTDVGQVREHNEDNFLVADLSRRSRGLLEANRATVIGDQGAVFAVCDGMGGAAAGEIASQLAVDIIYERLVDGLGDRPVKRDDLARRLVRAVESAGLRIFHEAKADRSRRGMGTTVTAAALVDEVLFFAQVGDSRGYILRGDTLVQLTRDQSLVNQLIEAGQLTEEEAETFEHNNIILQALGTSDTVQVDLTYAEVRQGDILLLCSDGLSGMVRFEDIRETLRSGAEPLDICKALTERANQAGGHDNITVIIVQFDGASLKPVDTEAEPLKYRKYVLADESLEEKTAPMPAMSDALATADTRSDGPARAPSTAAAGWQEQGAHGDDHDYDRVDIPGTHVPMWMVIGIVAGVVVLLAGTAFLLLSRSG